MDVNPEDRSGAATAANSILHDGFFLACLFSIWLIGVILFAVLLRSLWDDDTAKGGGGKQGLLRVAIAGGVFGAMGFAVWVYLGLRFCWCCRSSGSMDIRHEERVLDVD